MPSRSQDAVVAQYRDPRYVQLLASLGSFMEPSPGGPNTASRHLCHELLERPQEYPRMSFFSDGAFEIACRQLQGSNEARVVQDITRLLVPSAEALGSRAAHLQCLVENVNEGWNNAVALARPRPQPDYSVGFRIQAFTPDQQCKLRTLVGSLQDASFFAATHKCYFPFLTCEAKRGGVSLDVADRQNAHSMTIAVRGVIELYRAAGRERELDGEILAFSFSHDHTSVRIYGHYAVLNGRHTAYYRYPIRTFSFTEHGGRERWTSYRCAKNIYDLWMPRHLQRIQSGLDSLPVQRDSPAARSRS